MSAAANLAMTLVSLIPGATGDKPGTLGPALTFTPVSAVASQSFTRSAPVRPPRKLPGLPPWRCERRPQGRISCALNVRTHVLVASGTYRAGRKRSSFVVRVGPARNGARS